MALQKEGTIEVPGQEWASHVKELDGRLKINGGMSGWASYFLYRWVPGLPPS